MKHEVKDLIDLVLGQNAWSKKKLAEHLGCGKNSLKAWEENGAPYYVILALKCFI